MSDCQEPLSPWNKRKQRKHSSPTCLFPHGEKCQLHPEDMCSSSLCFTNGVKAEIKVLKTVSPSSLRLSFRSSSSDFPSQSWHLQWVLLSWHPISWGFLLHCCLATWLLSHPRRGHSVRAKHDCFTYMSLKFPSCAPPPPAPEGIQTSAFPTFPPTVECARIWRVPVRDGPRESCCVGARWCMTDRHLLDLDHQPTAEPVLLLSSWNLGCCSQVFIAPLLFPFTSVLITCILPSFTETYTSTHKHRFCSSVIVRTFTDIIQDCLSPQP